MIKRLLNLFGSSGSGDQRPTYEDDFWYEPIGRSRAGANVTHDTALAHAAVYACVRAISDSISSLPLAVFRRETNDDKTLLRTHPLFPILHDQADSEHTADEWRAMVQWHTLMRGYSVSAKRFGGNGVVGALEPWDPRYIEPRKIENVAGGSAWRFRYAAPGEPIEDLGRSTVFIVRGPKRAPHDIFGLDPITIAKETIGTALAVQHYGDDFFRNDASPPGVLGVKSGFASEEDRKNFLAAWKRHQSGSNRHQTAVLPADVSYEAIGITNEQAQFLESKKYSTLQICQIFRVPPHKIGVTDATPRANVEMQSREYVMDTLLPLLVRFEKSVFRDLIGDSSIFVEHNVEGLLRGDTATRFAAYQTAVGRPWLSANEARRLENRNAIAGGDEIMQPLNMAPASDAANTSSNESLIHIPRFSYQWQAAKDKHGLRILRTLS